MSNLRFHVIFKPVHPLESIISCGSKFYNLNKQSVKKKWTKKPPNHKLPGLKSNLVRMRGEHTSPPTACHPRLSHPHSTCGYWIRDITGYGICAYPPRYQVIYQLSVNLPNPLLLILRAPTTAIASQFTKGFVNKFPPFICSQTISYQI